ncbi:hypothetical protein B10525_17690 (plasmid) [Campylobacter jejuni]|nr:hypothetical protein B10525_17690 [Campylobacter jejuni]
MSNKAIINKQEVQFGTKGNQIFCTSLDVAKVFDKEHKNILRDIENILNDLREIGICNVSSILSFHSKSVKYKVLKAEKENIHITT